jgi:hypothetical protein
LIVARLFVVCIHILCASPHFISHGTASLSSQNVWFLLLVVGCYCAVRPVLLRYYASSYTTLIGFDPTDNYADNFSYFVFYKLGPG